MKNPLNVVGKRGSQQKKKVKKKKTPMLARLFLPRITAEVRDNVVQEETVNLVDYLPLSALFPFH